MRAAGRMGICLLVLLCLSAPMGLCAAAEPHNPESARRLAQEVLARHDAPASRLEYRWERRERKEVVQERKSGWWRMFDQWLDRIVETFLGLRQPIARLGTIGILLALVVALSLYLLYIRRLGPWRARSHAPGSAPEQPDMLFGLDVRPESLPHQPDEASLALWRAGRRREALALLYRAALSRFIHEYRVDLHPSLTELECQGRITRQGHSAQSVYFQRLNACWIRLAYGHEQLDDSLHRELAQGWKEAFG